MYHGWLFFFLSEFRLGSSRPRSLVTSRDVSEHLLRMLLRESSKAFSPRSMLSRPSLPRRPSAPRWLSLLSVDFRDGVLCGLELPGMESFSLKELSVMENVTLDVESRFVTEELEARAANWALLISGELSFDLDESARSERLKMHIEY